MTMVFTTIRGTVCIVDRIRQFIHHLQNQRRKGQMQTQSPGREKRKNEKGIPLATVLTLLIKLTDLALTLVLSYVAPNEGSGCCVRPQPILARNLSSERMAMALMMRMMTGKKVHGVC